jgi:hypothetical protein
VLPDGRDPSQLTREIEDWIEAEVARLGHPGPDATGGLA